MPRRADRYRVVGLDLPGFGYTEVPAMALRQVFVWRWGSPERVIAIVSQNGNAYEEGLGDAWAPIRRYWAVFREP
jgi:hypothetical protein